ncbi:transposase [Paraburkholderia youngii]
MVFKWRRQLRAGLFEGVAPSTAVLLPVALPDAPTGETAEPASLALEPVEPHRESVPAASGIEIELNGARVRVTGMVDPVQLRLVLRCLMPA